MRFLKQSAAGSAMYEKNAGIYVVPELGFAYRDDDPIVLQHPNAFVSNIKPVRAGYGKTVSEKSNRRTSVKIANPYSDIGDGK